VFRVNVLEWLFNNKYYSICFPHHFCIMSQVVCSRAWMPTYRHCNLYVLFPLFCAISDTSVPSNRVQFTRPCCDHQLGSLVDPRSSLRLSIKLKIEWRHAFASLPLLLNQFVTQRTNSNLLLYYKRRDTLCQSVILRHCQRLSTPVYSYIGIPKYCRYTHILAHRNCQRPSTPAREIPVYEALIH